jgi:hypothetical protein
MIHPILGIAGLIVTSIWFARLYPTAALAVAAFIAGAALAIATR